MEVSACLLFDDYGRVFSSQSRELRDRLDALQLGEGFIDYVVRNLGFVSAEVSGEVVLVYMRPSRVAPRALGALLYWLGDRPQARVVLRCNDVGGATHILLGPAPTAAKRLPDIVTKAQIASSRELLSRLVAAHSLPSDDPLRRLAALSDGIRMALRDRNFASLGMMTVPLTGGCYAVSVAEGDPAQARVEHVGVGYERHIGYWLERVIGHRMRDLPTVEYGSWTADAYAAALASGEPVIHEIDATVAWPRLTPRRHTYRRLLVPMRGEGGVSRILSAVVGDSRIDLRSERG